jgi:tRNA(Ile)-lysidine synthase
VSGRVAALLPPRARVCAGFSGGLDSTVLVDVLARLAGDGAIELTALHVHHGLSPNADAWAAACAAFCSERGIPLAIERVVVERAGEGLEAAARRARHGAYAARGEDCIALAHHREDQAETVLFNLLRGSGLEGARGMPEWRAMGPGEPHLFRPLLDVPRQSILDYARDQRLAWVEDESNARRDADRNYLRHEVAPRLDARFPGWRDAVARFARHARDAQARLEPGIDGALQGGRAGAGPDAAAATLRAFLAAHGLRMPSEARLAEMARQLLGARADAQVQLVHDGHVVTRYRDRWYVRPAGPEERAWRVRWSGELEVALGAARGSVVFESTTGAGIARPAQDGGDWYFAPRGGGERLRLHARGPSRTLKNLMQEQGMPPWERRALPLLFHGERLVWAPGIGIAAEYACGPGATGLAPSWRVARKASL